MQIISLWGDNVPFAVSDQVLDKPHLSIHLVNDAPSNGASEPNQAQTQTSSQTQPKCSVIVCPGGGYRSLASDHEGLQVAQWFNAHGISAFVLRYRLGPTYHSTISRLDAQRALDLVRANADAWGLDPEQVGMLGFSAGGHLALAVAVNSPAQVVLPNAAGVQQLDAPWSGRPNFVVPVYAVTNGLARGRKAEEYFPIDELVDAQTPPTFIMHTHQDSIVPASQATLLYEALLEAGVAAELHIYNDGDHGLGLNRGVVPGHADASHWGDLLLQWLRRRGFLCAQDRVSLQGRVVVDGQPMGLGWLTLWPDSATQPPVRMRLNHADHGQFSLDQQAGPVPGPHTAEIHWVRDSEAYGGGGGYSMTQALVHESKVVIAHHQPLDLQLRRTDFCAAPAGE